MIAKINIHSSVIYVRMFINIPSHIPIVLHSHSMKWEIIIPSPKQQWNQESSLSYQHLGCKINEDNYNNCTQLTQTTLDFFKTSKAN